MRGFYIHLGVVSYDQHYQQYMTELELKNLMSA